MFFHRNKFSESETLLLQRAARWPEFSTIESITGETLKNISQRDGVDFATTFLFDRFQKSSRHAKFIQRINALRKEPLPADIKLDAKVVIVPGALYVERPDLGGDGKLVREVVRRLGWPCDFIPLTSAGSVVENARRIYDWLGEHSGEKIVLVSLSKGGADLKMALSMPDATDLLHNVIAWVNVCGPLNGSRIADWILASRLRTCFFRAQFWLQKRDFKFITDMRHDSDAPLDFPLNLLATMKVLNIVGFPLRRHLTTPFSRFCHRTLSAHGPNDGTISLSDLLSWPGEIYPAWGMDHYFRPENVAMNLVTAILQFLAEEGTNDAIDFAPQLAFTNTGNKSLV